MGNGMTLKANEASMLLCFMIIRTGELKIGSLIKSRLAVNKDKRYFGYAKTTIYLFIYG